MVVVDKPPSDPLRVYFGAWVSVEDDAGEATDYRIVGPDEFDRPKGLISMDSPLGKALMRKAVDAELSIELPTGKKTFTVVAIRYEDVATGD